MNSQLDEHHQLVVEQFTKQAAPFLGMEEHSEGTAMQLLLSELSLSKSDTVLDVACGPGIVACRAAETAETVVGIDITPAMIEQAKAQQEKTGLTNLSWQVADVMNLPFPDGAFSRVVTRYAFHHFVQPETVFKEMLRVCKPGGKVVVADVFTAEDQSRADCYNEMEKLRDPSHTRALKQSELAAMFRDGSLADVRVAFYRLQMALDKILAASFPNAGDAEALSKLFRQDIEQNQSGFEPYFDETGSIRFSFPVMVISGVKSLRR